MKKPIIYNDTSVYGGYFDIEFRDETALLFDRIGKSEFVVMYSDLVQGELQNAPNTVKQLVKNIEKDVMLFVETSQEAFILANEYIEEGVVGKTSFADCLHIALASINNADILVSWNYKHIVNVRRIKGYNSVNIMKGYKQIDIRSPKELIYYED